MTFQTFLFKDAEAAISRGIKFASAESYYWKYVGYPRNNFSYWSSKCEGNFFLVCFYRNL